MYVIPQRLQPGVSLRAQWEHPEVLFAILSIKTVFILFGKLLINLHPSFCLDLNKHDQSLDNSLALI